MQEADIFEVIFIAPKNYLDIGINASSELMKNDYFLSKAFSLEDFNKKCFDETANRIFISIGDAGENQFSKEIINKKIGADQTLIKEPGMYIVASKPYAVIFGESDYSYTDCAKDMWETLKGNIKKNRAEHASETIVTKDEQTPASFSEKLKTSAKQAGNAIIAASAITKAATSPSIAAISIVGTRNSKRNKLKKHGAELGLGRFLSEIFPKWISREGEV